jgi:hypothetical protein
MLGRDFIGTFLGPWAIDNRPLITDAAPAATPALRKSLLPIISLLLNVSNHHSKKAQKKQ